MIQSLTSLRFLFILLIVLFHIVGERFEFGGDCGVTFFLMLSGFVLSYAYGQRVLDGQFRTCSFIKKQLVKFYPLHLLMLVVMVLLEARLERYYEWYQLLPSVLLIQSWFPFDSIIQVGNASSWFLCAIVFGYAVFAMVFRFIHRVSPKYLMVMIVAVLMLYGGVVSGVPMNKLNYIVCLSPLLRVLDFCIGILVWRFCMSLRGEAFGRHLQTWSAWQVTLLELMPVALVGASFFVYGSISPRLRCVSMFWLVLPFLLYVYVKTDKLQGWVTWLLHRPLMLWLGGISMEIYLTHWPVMRVFTSLLHSSGQFDRLPAVCVLLLTLTVVVLAAYSFQCCFVRPVQRKLSYLISSK